MGRREQGETALGTMTSKYHLSLVDLYLLPPSFEFLVCVVQASPSHQGIMNCHLESILVFFTLLSQTQGYCGKESDKCFSE